MSTTSEIVRRYADAAGAAGESNGYQYVDGTLFASVISKAIITASLATSWMVPGVSLTEEFTEGVDVNKIWSVYIQVQSNIGPRTRTIGPNGTKNNNGLINFAPAYISSTTPLEVKLNQVDDQPLFFPRMQMETIRYDVFESTMENYIDNTVISKATFETATAIAYSMYRASAEFTKTGNTKLPADQFLVVDKNKINDENYMINIVNEMDNKMAHGDKAMNAMSFSGPRAVACKLDFINALKTPKSGFVTVAGGDKVTEILLSASFDESKVADIFGGNTTQKRMDLRGYSFYEIPYNAMEYVEQWLGLKAGALNHFIGVITSPQQLASGGVTDVKPIVKEQASPYPGTYASPYRKFGARGYRNIICIVDSEFLTAINSTEHKTEFATLIGTMGAPDSAVTAPKDLVAPENFGTETVTLTNPNGGPSVQIGKGVDGAVQGH